MIAMHCRALMEAEQLEAALDLLDKNSKGSLRRNHELDLARVDVLDTWTANQEAHRNW